MENEVEGFNKTLDEMKRIAVESNEPTRMQIIQRCLSEGLSISHLRTLRDRIVKILDAHLLE